MIVVVLCAVTLAHGDIAISVFLLSANSTCDTHKVYKKKEEEKKTPDRKLGYFLITRVNYFADYKA